MRFYQVVLGSLVLLVAQEWPQQAQAVTPENDDTMPQRQADRSPLPSRKTSSTSTLDAGQTVVIPPAVAPPEVTMMPLERSEASRSFPRASASVTQSAAPSAAQSVALSELTSAHAESPSNATFDNAKYRYPDEIAAFEGINPTPFSEQQGGSSGPPSLQTTAYTQVRNASKTQIDPPKSPLKRGTSVQNASKTQIDPPKSPLKRGTSNPDFNKKQVCVSDSPLDEGGGGGIVQAAELKQEICIQSSPLQGGVRGGEHSIPHNLQSSEQEALLLAQTDSLTVEEKQKLESLREQYTLPELTETDLLDRNPTGALSSPGIAIGVPSAFGASWRNVFAGATVQERTRFTDRSDGAISVGFGLGDAQKAVGLEVAVAVVDLLGEGAFEDGSVSLKLHRQFEAGWAIAAGVENFATFGSTDGGSSGYGVVTKVTQLRGGDRSFNTLTTSLGIGGGRFRPEGRLDQDELNVFGSVAVRVAEPVSLIADWTGQDLNLGVSVVPFPKFPLVVTPAAVDVTGNAGDGVRFTVGLGIGHTF